MYAKGKNNGKPSSLSWGHCKNVYESYAIKLMLNNVFSLAVTIWISDIESESEVEVQLRSIVELLLPLSDREKLHAIKE